MVRDRKNPGKLYAVEDSKTTMKNFLTKRITKLHSEFPALQFTGIELPVDIVTADDLGFPLLWQQASYHAKWLGLDQCFPLDIVEENQDSPIGLKFNWRKFKRMFSEKDGNILPCAVFHYFFIADAVEVFMRSGLDLKDIADNGVVTISESTVWLKGILTDGIELEDLLVKDTPMIQEEPDMAPSDVRTASTAVSEEYDNNQNPDTDTVLQKDVMPPDTTKTDQDVDLTSDEDIEEIVDAVMMTDKH